MTNDTETFPEREEIEMLLPWYVTGKLDMADSARVDAAIARDATFARQLALIAEEQSESVSANEAIIPPRNLTPASTLSRIATTTSTPAGGLSRLLASVGDWFSTPSVRAVRWAGTAAAILILAQAGVIGALLRAPGPETFQPASGGASQTAGGSFALVRFADSATARDIAEMLSAERMTIVDGPKPGDLYRIRIGAADLSEAERAKRITTLKARTGIVLLVTPSP